VEGAIITGFGILVPSGVPYSHRASKELDVEKHTSLVAGFEMHY